MDHIESMQTDATVITKSWILASWNENVSSVFMLIYLTTPASVPTATNVPAVLIEPLQHSVTPRSISLSRVLFSISQILI